MKSTITRFRAYQLGCPGSSFSLLAGRHFTVLEARLTAQSRSSLVYEMQRCGVDGADTLHITSWDTDHCNACELEELLDLIHPVKIECPGYEPYSEAAKKSLSIIERYRLSRRFSNRGTEIRAITPEYISGLTHAEELAFRDTFYNPRWIDPNCANNNSTVKHFRAGSFNVLSLGDVEDHRISARLRRDRILKEQTDVMILAHHGADNGFTSKDFIARLRPKLAICSADYANQYDHPRQEIRDLLFEYGVRLMTTKTGDIIVKSIGDHTGNYRAINLKGNSKDISSSCDFTSKKARLLSFNLDTIRQRMMPRPPYLNLR
jgi:competence protein ComEC